MYSLNILRTIKSTLPSYTLVLARKDEYRAFLSFIKRNPDKSFKAIKIKIYLSKDIKYVFECIGFTWEEYVTELEELRKYLKLIGSAVTDLSYYIPIPIHDLYHLYRAGTPCPVKSSTIFKRYMKRANKHTNINKDTTA